MSDKQHKQSLLCNLCHKEPKGECSVSGSGTHYDSNGKALSTKASENLVMHLDGSFSKEEDFNPHTIIHNSSKPIKFTAIPICPECGSQRALPKYYCQTCFTNGWIYFNVVSSSGGNSQK